MHAMSIISPSVTSNTKSAARFFSWPVLVTVELDAWRAPPGFQCFCRHLLGWKLCAYRRFRVSWDPVYKLVKQIPRGRVTTYGALAKALRLRGGARTAGRAMAATPSGKGIPWHRVVGERGRLLIPEPYASLQRKFLQSEGIPIVEFRVDLRTYLWLPGKPSKTAVKQTKPRIRNERKR